MPFFQVLSKHLKFHFPKVPSTTTPQINNSTHPHNNFCMPQHLKHSPKTNFHRQQPQSMVSRSYFLIASILLMTSITFIGVSGDDIQTPVEPTSGLLCISECGTCPIICSPPPSPARSPESSRFPPLPPTPPLSSPSTPLLLPPSAPIFDLSPPPSFHAHPPPAQATPKVPSSSAPIVINPKSAQSPPGLPYVIVPGGPTPPLGGGSNYPYPYYYFYSNEASLCIPSHGFWFSVLLLLLIHVFCSCI